MPDDRTSSKSRPPAPTRILKESVATHRDRSPPWVAATLPLLHSLAVDDEPKRKTSNRGLLIRLGIYVPLIAYFGYGAIVRYRAEQAANTKAAAPANSPDGAIADPFEGLEAKEMVLPDGRVMPVYEVTPEQAAALGLSAAESGLPTQPLPAPAPGGTPLGTDEQALAEEGAATKPPPAAGTPSAQGTAATSPPASSADDGAVKNGPS